MIKKAIRPLFIIVFCNITWIILNGSTIMLAASTGMTPTGSLISYSREQTLESVPTNEIVQDSQWQDRLKGYQLFSGLIVFPLVSFMVGILAAWLQDEKKLIITYLSTMAFTAFMFLNSLDSIPGDIKNWGLSLYGFHRVISPALCILTIYLAHTIIVRRGSGPGENRKEESDSVVTP